MILRLTIILSILVGSWAAADEKKRPTRSIPYMTAEMKQSLPQRRDTPLREENITDVEVQQIEAVMQELVPQSIVYISGVTTGCPCQDGPDCSEQVWSIAQGRENSVEISLSRINGQWVIGPLQNWWIERWRITAVYRKSRESDEDSRRMSYLEYMDRLVEHNEKFPFCASSKPASTLLD